MNYANSINKYEVLAPAGSYECMIAAFNAGADAVYVGGQMFGARAFANNFNTEELVNAINYAHLHDKKIFLTVNTLLKNQEIKNNLIEYIKPLYEAGLDAVIVQDFGVLELIKHHFPDIDIHASTQMTVTGGSFASELKKLGVARIVPARELSLKEIKNIYDKTNLEIECFVHGALCYSYSGMCLFSSLIGGRSGNRGRCAQPCRLPYDIKFEDKKINKEYPLSPKDLCTLHILPDILEAGVYSLKIEGRMKKPEYVAIVTAMYRKYVDMYIKTGRNGYLVDENDIEILKDIYNRGGFTDGYFKRHNGSEMMSVNRPNHMGTFAAKIIQYDNNKKIITAKALKDIKKDDVLEIFLSDGQSVYIKTGDINKGQVFTVKQNLNGKHNYIMRTRNNMLIKSINELYLTDNTNALLSISMYVEIRKDKPIKLEAFYKNVHISIMGDIPEPASKRPITKEDIIKQLSKTGGTEFILDTSKTDIILEDNLFVNIKELNRLRREALEHLRDEIVASYKRVYSVKEEKISSITEKDSNALYTHTALVTNINQFNTVVNIDKIDSIYVEMDLISVKNIHDWEELINLSHKHNKKILLALPYITRTHAVNIIKDNIEFLSSSNFDGFVFRNMETVILFNELGIDCKTKVFDNSIYCANDYAFEFLKKYNPDIITCSYELNKNEIEHLDSDNLELCVYGYIPTMVTAGCIKKTYNKCDNKKEITYLKDRVNNNFFISNHCTFCYNIVYNSKPLYLIDILKDNLGIKLKSVRYNFINETKEQIESIISGCDVSDYTRGHFRRGVE